MIASITSLELDLKKFPIEIKAYSEQKLVKKWEFNSEKEAIEAQSDIWEEVFKVKMEKKDEITSISA